MSNRLSKKLQISCYDSLLTNTKIVNTFLKGGSVMKKRSFLFITFLLIAAVYFPVKLLAAPYYEGKRITIIVGFGPGGGNDRMARLLAKHLPKYIPGKPIIIVENMEGAGSIVAANHIYNIVKPDGLTIAALNKALPFAQLLKAEGVKFDLAKFAWVGSASTEPTVLALRSDLPYKTFGDLLNAKSEIILGDTSPIENSYQFANLLKDYVGLKVKIVIYSNSSADVVIAIESKEVDGRAGSYSSLKPIIERGLVRPLVRGYVSEPGIENLPVAGDLAKDPKAKVYFRMLSSPDQIGRPFVAPPGTPPDIMNILRKAFAEVANDPELKEEATKLRMRVEYLPADECLKVVNYALNQPNDVVTAFGKYVKF
jgi:tripartite-type tricarboxylate transporter receptor subunit TctC